MACKAARMRSWYLTGSLSSRFSARFATCNFQIIEKLI
jgi:hypothetical protein